jgi:hypothetical protein
VNRVGDIILYDGHLAVYKHSLDLIFYLLGGSSENELMLHAALSAFSDAVHMLLRNQVEKRALLENLDLVVLCLDETIDDGWVRHAHRCGALADGVRQCDRRDGLNDDRVAREPAQGGYNGDCDQRTNDHERVPDGEGKDAAAYQPTVAPQCVSTLRCRRTDTIHMYFDGVERSPTACPNVQHLYPLVSSTSNFLHTADLGHGNCF